MRCLILPLYVLGCCGSITHCGSSLDAFVDQMCDGGVRSWRFRKRLRWGCTEALMGSVRCTNMVETWNLCSVRSLPNSLA